MSQEEKSPDVSKIVKRILLNAGLSAPWKPTDSVEDFVKAVATNLNIFTVKKTDRILLIVMEAMSDQAAITLSAALTDPGTLEPKLKNETTYQKDLLDLIKVTFRPQVHPHEHVTKLLAIKYKPSTGTSMANHIALYAATFNAALLGLAGPDAEGLLGKRDSNPYFLRGLIESLPDYLRTVFLSKSAELWPKTLKDLTTELLALDANLTHRKTNLPAAGSSSAPTSPTSSSPKQKKTEGKQKTAAPSPPQPQQPKVRPEKPDNPCKFCNKGLYHWSDQCPEKDKKPSENLRNKGSSSPQIPPATALAGNYSKSSPLPTSAPRSLPTGVPVELSTLATKDKGCARCGT